MSARDPQPRSYGRLPLGIPATLETIYGRKTVRLVDLSQGGAHVVLPAELGIRDCVMTWLGFEVFCSAAWARDRDLGLTFEEPLPLSTLIATRNVAPSIIREVSLHADVVAREWVQGK